MNIDRIFDKVFNNYQTTNMQNFVYAYNMAEVTTRIQHVYLYEV
jgi:hypothetical protein